MRRSALEVKRNFFFLNCTCSTAVITGSTSATTLSRQHDGGIFLACETVQFIRLPAFSRALSHLMSKSQLHVKDTRADARGKNKPIYYAGGY
jgi:hypothetical protein